MRILRQHGSTPSGVSSIFAGGASGLACWSKQPGCCLAVFGEPASETGAGKCRWFGERYGTVQSFFPELRSSRSGIGVCFCFISPSLLQKLCGSRLNEPQVGFNVPLYTIFIAIFHLMSGAGCGSSAQQPGSFRTRLMDLLFSRHQWDRTFNILRAIHPSPHTTLIPLVLPLHLF